MATLHAFDTLAYTKALTDKGDDRIQAEALIETQREFFVKELASKDFVRDEIGKAKTELKCDIENLKLNVDRKIIESEVG